METIWTKTTALPQFPALRGDLAVDAAVIGGGLTGILTAYYLGQMGVHAVVLEANRIAGGQTRGTTAKITSGHGLCYTALADKSGIETARAHAEANELAIAAYRRLIEDEGIDCDLENCAHYLYATEGEDAPRAEFVAAQNAGLRVYWTRETELPFAVAGAIRFDEQARFHPLKLMAALASKLTIYEHTRVLDIEGNILRTAHGTVTAKQVVFACHYPFINAPGYYFLRMYRDRSYVLALEHAARLENMYLGVDGAKLSLRGYGDTLLFGGEGHRTGENSAGGRYARLRHRAELLWPGSGETGHWSAQDCMTLDGLPYIGRFAASRPDWYVATGYGKWGMTGAMIAARQLAGEMTGAVAPHTIYTPARFTPMASAASFLENGLQAAKGEGRALFMPPRATLEALPRGHGGIVSVDGEKWGVYKDDRGACFVVPARCPHLGCQLEWNPDEKSWDCPCHGSRFDIRGRLLDGPAQCSLETEQQVAPRGAML